MIKRSIHILVGLVLACLFQPALSDPAPGQTTVLGPFVGEGATLHPDNSSPFAIAFAGTDLGFNYEHDGVIKFLFGDSFRDAGGAPIESFTGEDYDDGFGEVDLATWSDPSTFSPSNVPLIKLGQYTLSSQAKALHPGHIMDLGKTPLAGFSNGEREFGIFLAGKPEGCLNDGHCSSGLTCDNDLGFWGTTYYNERGLTLLCMPPAFGCLSNTMAGPFGLPIPGSGFCSDETSTVWTSADGGRMAGVGLKLLIGIRSATLETIYDSPHIWLTNKFMNLAAATVEDFVPSNGSGGGNQDYTVATDYGDNQRVLLWGRPGWFGVNANDRNMGLYFAYVDMPTSSSSFDWTVRYFTGVSSGVPQFSTDEADAAPLDLDSTVAGVQADEVHDIVNQMSIVWVDHLQKWVMFYGGGISTLPYLFWQDCGVLEFFVGPDCTDVDLGNGAIRMRTADDPWGPWSPPQDVLVGGDPDASPLQGEYAEGGVLYHPDCSGNDCIAHTPGGRSTDDPGFLYSPNIVAPWIDVVGDDVDVIWNVSTWNPYTVFLLRTRIESD